MVKEACTVPYDPTPPAKTKSTYDAIAESCTVEYKPSTPGKTFTTHDQATMRHTSLAPRNRVGDTQIFKGDEFVFDGDEWKLLDDLKSELEIPDHQFIGQCVVELIKNDAPIDDIREHSHQAASLALDLLGRE
jgi:hypothetical protein